MQIYEVLKRDHQALKNILEQLEESSENAVKRRQELLGRLHRELVPHARAEERVLYEVLKDIEATKEIALEAYEEHSAAEMLLRELEAMDPSDERFQAKLSVLKENLEHHIEEEEGEMFTQARAVLAPEEAQMMGVAFESLKQEVGEGSLVQSTIDRVAQLMPPRFAKRFTEITRNI